MASLNKAQLIGHLGADPETRYTTGGDAVCTIRLATTESWRDKSSGEQREATEWHRVVFYRRMAEVAGQYLRKGSQVYIEGKIVTNKWTDKDGIERYTTQINGTEMKMLGKRDASQPSSGGNSQNTGVTSATETGAPIDDDIPF